MGAPIIWAGTAAKTLKAILDINGEAQIHSGTTDPSSVAVSAPIGSLYLNDSNGKLYRKTDAGLSTNWVEIASLSGTETLSNKSLVDSTTNIIDNLDNTKKMQFQVSGVTAGQTRVLTVPDTDITILGQDNTATVTGKTMTGPDGSSSNPTYSFSNDPNTGIYRVGADDMSLVAGGFTGLEVKKSTGSFANVGLGSAPSASDSYPVLISRSNTSAGTVLQVANPSTSANAKGSLEVSTDNGNNTGELSVYTAASTVESYIDALVLRSTGSTSVLSLVAGVANSTVRIFAGGVLAANEVAKFNSDLSFQMVQEIATPANPSAGLKIYTKSDKKLYTLDTSGNERALATGSPAVGSGGPVAVSGTVNLTSGDTGKVYIVDTSAARTINLPTASSGLLYTVVDGTGTASINAISVVPSGAAKIRGINTTYACEADYGSWTFFSNGTDWFII